MRFLFPFAAACLLIACREQGPADGASPRSDAKQAEASALVTYAGAGRDRLCLNPQTGRAGFITYGEGNNNCSVRGAIGDPNFIRPDGDTACTIIFNRDGESIQLLAGGPGCSYYCGPTASFAGKSFKKAETAEPVTDLAGDPLC